jgi:hypothetical protein
MKIHALFCRRVSTPYLHLQTQIVLLPLVLLYLLNTSGGPDGGGAAPSGGMIVLRHNLFLRGATKKGHLRCTFSLASNRLDKNECSLRASQFGFFVRLS